MCPKRLSPAPLQSLNGAQPQLCMHAACRHQFSASHTHEYCAFDMEWGGIGAAHSVHLAAGLQSGLAPVRVPRPDACPPSAGQVTPDDPTTIDDCAQTKDNDGQPVW